MASWPRLHDKQQFLSTLIHLLAVNVLSDSFWAILKSVREGPGAGQVSECVHLLCIDEYSIYAQRNVQQHLPEAEH